MAESYQNIDVTSLFDAAKEIVDVIRENYIKEGMSPQGKLANFTWTVNFNNNLFQLQLTLPPEWKWVEFGRNPSQKMPPVSAIEQWIQTKRLAPKAVNGQTPSTRSRAFAIAKKIQKEGFYSPNHQGKHVLENSLNELQPEIEKLCNLIISKLEDGVNKEISSLFNGLKSFDTKQQ